jgi:hypothetical protein
VPEKQGLVEGNIPQLSAELFEAIHKRPGGGGIDISFRLSASQIAVQHSHLDGEVDLASLKVCKHPRQHLFVSIYDEIWISHEHLHLTGSLLPWCVLVEHVHEVVGLRVAFLFMPDHGIDSRKPDLLHNSVASC